MRSLLFLTLSIFLFIPAVFPEGTKQLKPDSTKNCDIIFSSESIFYPCTGLESCDSLQKMYVRVGSSAEKVYIGLKTAFGPGGATFRIKLGQITVFGPRTISNGSIGWINYFSQAYAGPEVLSPNGYKAVVFEPEGPGDYSIDFDAQSLTIFDVTVIDTTIVPKVAIDGRLYSRDWQFSTGAIYYPEGEFLATQYILTEDSVVTSVYYNEMRGHHFDVTSTRNGCYPPPVPWDSSCRSDTGNHHYAQYRIFVNDPDPVQFPSGILGTINPSSIVTTPSCDGSVSISFTVNKPGTVRINLEIDPTPGIQPVDVSLLDSVISGSNTVVWNGINGLGNPVPVNTVVNINLTYVNGLTNMALFDVETHPKGFIISQIRPFADSIATYWNDTLLRSKGGMLQLSGCYPAHPDLGCHAWEGDYNGVGIGSMNSVNTWWYATSSVNTLSPVTIIRPPDSVVNILGMTTVCNSAIATYSLYPTPLPGANPDGFEWIMVDVVTGITVFDSAGNGSTFTIHFSGIPPGPKYLKARGTNQSCGAGPYGPGVGILINILAAPSITNPVNTFSLCSGDMFNLPFQLSPTTASVSYTATATSPYISGYSGGTQNPLSQVLTTTGTVTDSVIYTVVPFSEICPGDTSLFYVRVNPEPEVTNSQTTFEQCSGISTNLLLTGSAPGVNFSWIASGSSPYITGYSNDTGTVIAQTLINTNTSPETVTYIVTPALDSCPGNTETFIVAVDPPEPVSVAITASSNPFCIGTSVTFNAVPVNGGTSPSFQWQVNGINTGSNSSIFTYLPSANDNVLCTLTSSQPCVSGNPASSDPMIMIGDPGLPAGVSVIANPNPFCQGTTVSFTATPMNGGTNPTYQWKVNGADTGINSAFFSCNPLDHDSVCCIMTSNLFCVSANPAISGTIIMNELPLPWIVFTPCFDTITATSAQPFKLRGGIPLGGTYSGPGVLNGYFHPAVAGPGNHLITYTYTNSALCTDAGCGMLDVRPAAPFTCGDELLDNRDSSVYSTVQIASQCWFSENLIYGNTIPIATPQRDNCIPERYCPDTIPVPCASGNALYQWSELMTYTNSEEVQGLCPPGWHVPSENDWAILFAYWTNSAFAGAPLKYTGYSGFNAFLNGSVFFNRNLYLQGFATFFWSSTSHGPVKALAHGMNEYNYSVSYYPAFRANAFSVRCVMD